MANLEPGASSWVQVFVPQLCACPILCAYPPGPCSVPTPCPTSRLTGRLAPSSGTLPPPPYQQPADWATGSPPTPPSLPAAG